MMSKGGVASKAANPNYSNTLPTPGSVLPSNSLHSSNGAYNLGALALHFMAEGRLAPKDAEGICDRATALLREQPNVLALSSPVTVVGCLNGHFYDLMKIVKMVGSFGREQYLFLGDYIGGGGFSLECFLFVLAAKVTYPEQVHLLRGSHESSFMFEVYGLKEHCERLYSQALQQKLFLAFNTLPLAATVDEKYFCVHGGLSPDISRVEDINEIFRFRDVPSHGAMCDLLWSDPHWDVENTSVSVLQSSAVPVDYYLPSMTPFDTNPTFQNNEGRGCSYLFNFACVRHFCSVNNLLCVVRSHEPQEEGFKLYRANPKNNFPAMVSVFSAPNYCDSIGNKGAVLRIAEGSLDIQQLFPSPHPILLQNLNGITWSLPFALDCASSFAQTFMNAQTPGDDYNSLYSDQPHQGQ